MNTDKIKIYADEENKVCLTRLLSSLMTELSVNPPDMAIIVDGSEFKESGSDSLLVISAEDKREYKENKTLSYSMDGFGGDVSLLNLQERTEHKSFEILYKSFMGRVFLPYSSKYTEKQVLIVTTAMLLMGAEAKALLTAVNEIIKKGE